MGFLRQLFGGKKALSSRNENSGGCDPKPLVKVNKKWNFVRSHQEKNQGSSSQHPNASASRYADNLDANKHAIAVAAATAAVAEAALAAAQAAAQVVRLTSGGGVRGRCGPVGHGGGRNNRWLQEVAAVKIQAAFRGYLARRARRALKALVKLQALVRGHIVRKRTADMLRRIQTLVRLQTRACASRAHMTGSLRFSNNSLSRHPVLVSPEKNEHQLRTQRTKVEDLLAIKRSSSNSNLRDTINLEKARPGSNWLDHWMEESLWNRRDTAWKNWHFDDERSDKILEVDTWKPRANSQQSNRTFHSSHNVFASDFKNQDLMISDSPSKYSTKAPRPVPSPSLSSMEALSFSSVNFPVGVDEIASRTAENSPQVFSASSRPGSSARKGPFTPSRSECSWGYFNSYPAHPNYMANTECSRAKVRSHSAPKQRLELEKHSSAKRFVQGSWDEGTNSERGFALHSDWKNKTYQVPGHLNSRGSANSR